VRNRRAEGRSIRNRRTNLTSLTLVRSAAHAGRLARSVALSSAGNETV
jgi:hypothetical protein